MGEPPPLTIPPVVAGQTVPAGDDPRYVSQEAYSGQMLIIGASISGINLALADKANASAVTLALADKADAMATTTALAGKANTDHNHTGVYVTPTDLSTAVNPKLDPEDLYTAGLTIGTTLPPSLFAVNYLAKYPCICRLVASDLLSQGVVHNGAVALWSPIADYTGTMTATPAQSPATLKADPTVDRFPYVRHAAGIAFSNMVPTLTISTAGCTSFVVYRASHSVSLVTLVGTNTAGAASTATLSFNGDASLGNCNITAGTSNGTSNINQKINQWHVISARWQPNVTGGKFMFLYGKSTQTNLMVWYTKDITVQIATGDITLVSGNLIGTTATTDIAEVQVYNKSFSEEDVYCTHHALMARYGLA